MFYVRWEIVGHFLTSFPYVALFPIHFLLSFFVPLVIFSILLSPPCPDTVLLFILDQREGSLSYSFFSYHFINLRNGKLSIS